MITVVAVRNRIKTVIKIHGNRLVYQSVLGMLIRRAAV